jgi:ketosteroid isomerase-like protein
MLSRSVLFTLLLMVVAGCGGGNTEVGFTRADGEAIRSILQEFSETFGENDASALIGDYSANAMVLPPNSSTVRGPESIEGFFGTLFSEGKASLVLEPGDLEADGTLGVINGSYLLEIVPEGDSEGQRDRGKFVWVLRKLQGRWYIQQQIWNSDLPPKVQREPKSEPKEEKEEEE